MEQAPLAAHRIRSDEPISVRLSDDNNTAYHSHDFLEFAYVREGSAVQYFNNEPIRVCAGDFFMINYGEKHKYSPDGDNPVTAGSARVTGCTRGGSSFVFARC